MARKSLGMECQLCHEVLSKGTILSHLKKCICIQAESPTIHAAPAKQESLFWLKVEGFDDKQYCIYLQVKKSAQLVDLDLFLRNLWLECCGHLSQFIINGEFYISMPETDDEDDKDMYVKLKSVLDVGLAFIHEYDFGSTTTLKITVIDERMGLRQKGKVKLLARNVAPSYQCANCGKLATVICVNCLYEHEKETFLCDDCIDEHECGDEGLLPVVNSPRMGVCGYTGETDLD